MTNQECFELAVRNGIIRKETFHEIKDFFQSQPAEEVGITMSDAQKKKMAQMLKDNLENKKEEVKTILARKKEIKSFIDDYIKQNPKQKGKANVAVLAILAEEKGLALKFDNIERVDNGLTALFMQKLASPMNELRAGMFNTSNKSLSHDVVRAIKNEADPKIQDKRAIKWAKQFKEVFNDGFELFKEAGGGIVRRQNWDLPNMYNPAKISKATREDWISNTRKHSYTARELDDDELGLIYDSIITDGTIRIEPKLVSKELREKAQRISRMEHRLIDFNNADDWLAFNALYGKDDVYGGMVDHIKSMTQDIALLKVMGPKPKAMLGWMKDYAKLIDGKSENAIDGLYRQVSGEAYSFHLNKDYRDYLYKGFGAVRNMNVASKLGSAILPAMLDTVTMFATSGVHNMNPLKVMLRAVKLMSSKEKQEFAVKLTGSANNWLGVAGSSRFDEAIGYGWSSKLANTLIRISGLQLWTDSMKRAWGMEYLSHFEKIRKKDFNSLGRVEKQLLDSYGITDKQWEYMSKMPDSEDGFFRFEKIEDRDVMVKFSGMLRNESNYAILEPNARTQFWTNWGLERGTLGGEAVRSVMQFKSFPIVYMLSHVQRAMRIGDTRHKLQYGAFMITAGTAVGALVIQAQNLRDGKSPEDMSGENAASFWMRAFSKAGAFGFYGDILFGDLTQFGRSLGEGLAGPSIGTVGDIGKTIQHLAQEAVGKTGAIEDKDRASKITRLAYKNIPFQNLWYTKAATDRYIKNNLLKLVDEKSYRQAKKRVESNMKKKGQDWLWEG